MNKHKTSFKERLDFFLDELVTFILFIFPFAVIIGFGVWAVISYLMK